VVSKHRPRSQSHALEAEYEKYEAAQAKVGFFSADQTNFQKMEDSSEHNFISLETSVFFEPVSLDSQFFFSPCFFPSTHPSFFFFN
jgi:hypothetical protein